MTYAPVAMLAVFSKHTIASGASQGESPTAVGVVEHTHGYEVKSLLFVNFLLLQYFLFRHVSLFQNFYHRPPSAVFEAAIAAKIDIG